MSLSPGTRLGAYEILALIGAGGMGEVYRARDTKLGREVAIKVLPEAWAFDADRAARFEREGQVLAALNHPHIAALHGMEQSAGRHVLIMELVEGETLAERLARGALPVKTALEIARQMAEAVEAAHEKGITHRDLKPANVKITPNEQVKVLDFGLAKAMEPVAPGVSAAAATNSPTLSMMATQAGVILGTAAYMSPEQAQGLAVDARSDVFSFGSVLYEMLTGRQPFQGDTVAALLASVLVREPDLGALPPNLNPRLPELLKRCFEKNPKRRWQAVGDLRAEIETIAATPYTAATTIVVAPPQPLWRRLAFIGAPALVIGAAVAVAVTWLATRPVPPHVTRTTITASGTAALTIGRNDRNLALSPDGTHLVYVGNNGAQLFVRALDALEPVAIASGTPRQPFVSPTGQWVGFVDSTTLKKVAITGGPPITLARLDGFLSGATWAPDDTIMFATNNTATGLQRVSVAGGTPEVLTRPDHARGEADHLWPELLPGGRAVLFTIAAQTGGLDAAQIAVRDLRTGTQQILIRGGSDAHYVASGHLVYTAAGTLRAIPFDLNRLETRGTAVPVVPRLVTTPAGAGDFAVATDGTLVYVDTPGGSTGTARTLVWVDRMGKEEAIVAPPRGYLHPRLSPDGTRVALYIGDQENDLWSWDLRRATLTRLTFEPGDDAFPMWTPDGRRIIFASARAGSSGRLLNVWWQAADGTGAAERLTTSSNAQLPTGIAPDGMQVVFSEGAATTGSDLLRLALDGSHRVTPLLQTKFEERNGIVSPDGRWLAYESNSSGRFEIYVRPFPNAGGGQWQVSTGGGTTPLWARNGKELFYVGPDGALLRVLVEASSATWNAGTPAKLLEGRYFTAGGGETLGRTYDASPDGQRFLMIKAPGADATAAPPSIIVVQHWDEELKRLVPTK